MQCPKCRTDVPEGHFYCPSCRTLLADYQPERPARGPLERAGARLLDLFLAVVIIGGLVMTARMVNWREFLTQIRGEMKETGQTDQPANRASATPNTTSRHSRTNQAVPSKTGSPETVRPQPQKQQKVEDLPAVQVQPDIRLVQPLSPPTPPPTPKTAPPSPPRGY